MQFHLSTLLWFFVVVACALGTFGVWGIAVLAFLLFQMPIPRSFKGRVGLIVFWGLFGLLYSVVHHGHPEVALMYDCQNNLKQIGVALEHYHDDYGQFPPAYVADAQGQPMHSWRVLLLPYLGYEDIYNQYRFDEPWDSPHNKSLASQYYFQDFECPKTSAVESSPPDTTHYVAVTGPGTAWPGEKGTCFKDFSDGTSKTILLVEIKDSDIHWMEPRDITLDEALRYEDGDSRVPSSYHWTGGVYFWDKSYSLIGNILMADGSAFCIPIRPSRENLAALLSIDSGDSIDVEQIRWAGWPYNRLDLSRCIGYPLFFLSLILLVRSAAGEKTPARLTSPPEQQE